MTFLNFSDYLKSQLQRDVKREEFSRFILNQQIMKIGKRSEINSNISFYYQKKAEVASYAANVITGDKLEFYSCDRNSIYYLVEQPGDKQFFLKAELDKATVANNFVLLVKNVVMVETVNLAKPTDVVTTKVLEKVYA